MKTSDAVDAFLLSAQARGLSKRTISWYGSILRAYVRFSSELPFTPELCEQFILSCKGGDERRHGYYRTLRAFYNYAERRLDIDRNPIRKLDPPKREKKLPKPISPTDVAKLWAQPMIPEVRAAIRFFMDTGARLGECHRMTIDDLLATPMGYMARIRGKGKREHLVPIRYETYHDLMIVLPFRFNKDWLGRKVSAVCKKAGIDASAHNLRHTFGTYWDGTLDVLQNIMGHSTITTTMIYRQVRPMAVVSQHAQFSPARTMLSGQETML